jgi:hypothetical protein
VTRMTTTIWTTYCGIGGGSLKVLLFLRVGSVPDSPWNPGSFTHLSDRSPLVPIDQERSLPVSIPPHTVRRASHGDYLSVQTGLQTIDESVPDLRAAATRQLYEYGAITHDTHDPAFQEDGGIRGHTGSLDFKDISIPTGTSTYGQTLFNTTAILLGIGMLSEPLAFALSGWIGGTCLIIFYGAISCYSCVAISISDHVRY